MKTYRLILTLDVEDNIDIDELTFKELPKKTYLMDFEYEEIKK